MLSRGSMRGRPRGSMLAADLAARGSTPTTSMPRRRPAGKQAKPAISGKPRLDHRVGRGATAVEDQRGANHAVPCMVGRACVTLEPLLSPEDIAELVGMSYHGVLRAIRSGELKATRKGKGYHVTRAWFEEWLEADVVVPMKTRPHSPAGPRRGPVAAGTVADLERIEREERPAA